MPVRCRGLVHYRGFMKQIKKNYMKKNCCNSQYFQGKNYKAKFSNSSILKKIKSTKIILKKNQKKNEREKNQAGKHCSNL